MEIVNRALLRIKARFYEMMFPPPRLINPFHYSPHILGGDGVFLRVYVFPEADHTVGCLLWMWYCCVLLIILLLYLFLMIKVMPPVLKVAHIGFYYFYSVLLWSPSMLSAVVI